MIISELFNSFYCHILPEQELTFVYLSSSAHYTVSGKMFHSNCSLTGTPYGSMTTEQPGMMNGQNKLQVKQQG